ncbi:MAG: ketopantoate reductase family protein [Spirochaetaceae bacterium]
MRIGIIGFGALGGLYGHFFSRAPETETVFIASGDRFERLRAQPLTVNGEELNIPVEQAGKARSPVDLILFAVKHHHLQQAIEDVSSHVGESTVFISVMNGIESEERIAEAFGEEHVLYSVALGMDALREDNRVRFSTPGQLLVGRAHNDTEKEPDPDLALVQNLCDECGLPWGTPVDMIRNLWWKFMINIGINQTSALLKASYGTFIESSHARSVMIRAMEEVIEVASKKGVYLDTSDIDQFVHKIIPSMSPEGKTSMCQDVEARRKTEVEMFSGTLIRIAEEHGIQTPVNRTLFSLIKGLEHTFAGTHT